MTAANTRKPDNGLDFAQRLSLRYLQGLTGIPSTPPSLGGGDQTYAPGDEDIDQAAYNGCHREGDPRASEILPYLRWARY